MNKQNDLKAVLSKLIVKPNFERVEKRKEVIKNQGSEFQGTENRFSQKESAENEDSWNEHIKNEDTDFKDANKQSTKFELSQNENDKNKSTEIEHPKNESFKNKHAEKESPGFFRMSRRVYSDKILRSLSGDCFKLFLWMCDRAWGYQDSDGTTRAAVDFTASRVGLTTSTVSRCFNVLKEKGLITLLEKNYKLGNLWGVSSIGFDDGSPEKKGVKKQSAGPSKSESSTPKIRTQHSENRGHLKSSLRNSKEFFKKGDSHFQEDAFKSKLKSWTIEDNLNAEELILIEKCFSERVPMDEMQTKIIEAYELAEFGGTEAVFKPPKKVIREMALKAWYESFISQAGAA